MVKVVAIETGFYAGQRRRVGEFFHMDETKWTKKAKGAKEGDKPRAPRWVKVVTSEAEARVNEAKALLMRRHR